MTFFLSGYFAYTNNLKQHVQNVFNSVVVHVCYNTRTCIVHVYKICSAFISFATETISATTKDVIMQISNFKYNNVFGKRAQTFYPV